MEELGLLSHNQEHKIRKIYIRIGSPEASLANAYFFGAYCNVRSLNPPYTFACLAISLL
jgi:hypothetical protein